MIASIGAKGVSLNGEPTRVWNLGAVLVGLIAKPQLALGEAPDKFRRPSKNKIDGVCQGQTLIAAEIVEIYVSSHKCLGAWVYVLLFDEINELMLRQPA